MFVMRSVNLKIRPVIVPENNAAGNDIKEMMIAKSAAPMIKVISGIIMMLENNPEVFNWFMWKRITGRVIICAESVTAVVSANNSGRFFNEFRYCL